MQAVAPGWQDELTDIYTNLLKYMAPEKPETCSSLTIILFGPPEQEMQNIAFTDFFLSLFFFNKHFFSWSNKYWELGGLFFFRGVGVSTIGNNWEILSLSSALLCIITSSLGIEKHVSLQMNIQPYQNKFRF